MLNGFVQFCTDEGFHSYVLGVANSPDFITSLKMVAFFFFHFVLKS